MSDYQPTEDIVAWDDWMQSQADELWQPFSAPTSIWSGNQACRDTGIIAPHVSNTSFIQDIPLSVAPAWEMLEMDQLQHEQHSTLEQNLGFTGTTQASDESLAIYISESDANPDESATLQSSKPDIIPLCGFIYPKNNCATCGALLDFSESMLHDQDLYCSSDTSTTHLSVQCGEKGCGKKFPRLEDLKRHCFSGAIYGYGHRPFCCAIVECNARLPPWGVSSHFQQFHPNLKYRCAECGTGFNSCVQLDEHGSKDMHGAYTCLYLDCGSEFTRISDLTRHQLSHKKNVIKLPCRHCRKYRGNNGFKRKDHLRQHIRNYHHIDHDNSDNDANFNSQDEPMMFPCPFANCDKVGINSFETAKLRNAHLKKEHPSPFQCPHAGCDRIGTKGWMRERDMVKHMKKAHGF